MYSIKQEIRATGVVSPEIPTSVFVISLHNTIALSAFLSRQKKGKAGLFPNTSRWPKEEEKKRERITLSAPEVSSSLVSIQSVGELTPRAGGTSNMVFD